MQILSQTFEDRTFRYAQVARQGQVAIYMQTHKTGGAIRYEVVRIQIAPAHTWPNGQTTPEHEAYPSSSAWGRLGHTFYTEQAARVHFDRLCASQKEPQS